MAISSYAFFPRIRSALLPIRLNHLAGDGGHLNTLWNPHIDRAQVRLLASAVKI